MVLLYLVSWWRTSANSFVEGVKCFKDIFQWSLRNGELVGSLLKGRDAICLWVFFVCVFVCKSLGWIPGDLLIINDTTVINVNWCLTKLKTTGDYRLAHLYVLKLTTIDWMISNNLLLSIYHAEFTVLIFLLQ